jgi:hypothetical protein
MHSDRAVHANLGTASIALTLEFTSMRTCVSACHTRARAHCPLTVSAMNMTIASALTVVLLTNVRPADCLLLCRHVGSAADDASVLPSWTTLAAGSLVTATALQALIKAWGKGSSSRSGR